jgi:hypothetical protein
MAEVLVVQMNYMDDGITFEAKMGDGSKACRFSVWPIGFYNLLLQPAAAAKGRGLFWVPLED